MNTIARSVDLCGPIAAVRIYEQLSEEDRQLLKNDLEAHVPTEAVQEGSQELSRRIRKCVGLLVDSRPAQRIIMLGLDLDVLDALAREDYRGPIEILLPTRVSSLDLPTARRNLPRTLDARIRDPGLMPTQLGRNDCIVTVGFFAGADLVLVDRHVESTLGFVQGRRFHGHTCIIIPNPDHPYDARPALWNTIRLASFRHCCTPSEARQLEIVI